MKQTLVAIMAASLLLIAAGLADHASAQTQPLTIDTAGLTCTNGVCDLGSGNLGTFLNVSISASGGSGPTPFTWKVMADLPPLRGNPQLLRRSEVAGR